MIIHRIKKLEDKHFGRIECEIEFEKEKRKQIIWLTVEKQYEKYLCIDRADAFVVLLLPLAMFLNENIKCDLPVTDEMLYGLTRELIPAVTSCSKTWYPIQIEAKPILSVETIGKVGTGCSGGIDSLYTIKTNLNTGYPSFDITHLCVFNNITDIQEKQKVFDELAKNARRISQNIGLPLIIADSNCMECVPVPADYNFLNTYVILFYVLCLQKLFGRYYLASSGLGYEKFSVVDADKTDCSYYNLLTLSCLSNKSIKFISDGENTVRYLKTKIIADWEIAQKYLKVCNERIENCCVCGKCKRTIMALEALDKTKCFSNVFDPDKVNTNRAENYYWLFKRFRIGDDFVKQAYHGLKNSALMQEIIERDKVWNNLIYAQGLYEDGWLKNKFEAKSCKNPEETKMEITLYISNLTPENRISIYVEDERKIDVLLTEGLHTLEVEIPAGEKFSWRIESSDWVIPKSRNISYDIRELACVLTEVKFIENN